MHIINSIHSNLAYLVLGFVLLFTLLLVFGFLTKAKPNNFIRKVGLFALVFTHTQVLIGVVQYLFFSGRGLKIITSGNLDMGNSSIRLYTVEHPIMMLVGAILLTVVYSKIKRLKSSIGLGLVIMIVLAAFCLFSRVPYHNWLG